MSNTRPWLRLYRLIIRFKCRFILKSTCVIEIIGRLYEGQFSIFLLTHNVNCAVFFKANQFKAIYHIYVELLQ